jgi:hypothetical protein
MSNEGDFLRELKNSEEVFIKRFVIIKHLLKGRSASCDFFQAEGPRYLPKAKRAPLSWPFFKKALQPVLATARCSTQVKPFNDGPDSRAHATRAEAGTLSKPSGRVAPPSRKKAAGVGKSAGLQTEKSLGLRRSESKFERALSVDECLGGGHRKGAEPG